MPNRKHTKDDLQDALKDITNGKSQHQACKD
jgi:hypothetical protein